MLIMCNLGGTIHLTISNRCFMSKVIALWSKLDEQKRLELVGNYLHFSGFRDVEVVELVEGGGMGRWEGDWGVNDPLWVVRAKKL
jgi:hypothetical protein